MAQPDRQLLIQQAARRYLGKKYRHCGREADAGIDCIGLIDLVGRDIGLDWTLPNGYSRLPDGVTLIQEAHKYLVPVDRDYQPGDVVALFWRNAQYPAHLGIVGQHITPGNRTLIHTYTLVGKVVEHIIDENWRNRIVAVFEFPVK